MLILKIIIMFKQKHNFELCDKNLLVMIELRNKLDCHESM